MNVTLPKEWEEFVLHKTASGEYPNVEAVVVEALREFQSKVDEDSEPAWMRPLPDGSCPSELKAMLLKSVHGPHHPITDNYFDEIRRNLRREFK
jgi:Arc/MetJ-type ribon-helix-helix transcriptional regulator